MKSATLTLCTVLALAACAKPTPDNRPSWRSDTRQIPTNTEPGLHISGHVNVGVKKTF